MMLEKPAFRRGFGFGVVTDGLDRRALVQHRVGLKAVHAGAAREQKGNLTARRQPAHVGRGVGVLCPVHARGEVGHGVVAETGKMHDIVRAQVVEVLLGHRLHTSFHDAEPLAGFGEVIAEEPGVPTGDLVSGSAQLGA